MDTGTAAFVFVNAIADYDAAARGQSPRQRAAKATMYGGRGGRGRRELIVCVYAAWQLDLIDIEKTEFSKKLQIPIKTKNECIEFYKYLTSAF